MQERALLAHMQTAQADAVSLLLSASLAAASVADAITSTTTVAAAATATGSLSAHLVQQLPLRSAVVGTAGTHACELQPSFEQSAEPAVLQCLSWLICRYFQE
jgi:hypothetical protein